jgi:hypothetical protein
MNGGEEDNYSLLVGKPEDRYRRAHGNELSGSIKLWETIEWLHIWWTLE